MDDKKLMKRRTSLLEGKHKTKQKQAKISKPSTVKHLTLATNNLRSDSNVILEWHLHLVNEFGFSQTVFLVFFLLLEKVMSTVIYTSKEVFFKFILTNYLTINVHKSWTSGLLPKEEILLSSLELGSIRKESFSRIKPWAFYNIIIWKWKTPNIWPCWNLNIRKYDRGNEKERITHPLVNESLKGVRKWNSLYLKSRISPVLDSLWMR